MAKPNYSIRPEQIDALLPQTQCGDCGYGGCMPYAEAIVNQGVAINLCPPGGTTTLKRLGELLEQDVEPYLKDMQQQQKQPQLAKIHEDECIGCTKCIQACPVDAIIGTAKQMHVILPQECTGCGLCVTPCPVDCIDMVDVTQLNYQPEVARHRYNAKQQRAKKSKKQNTLKTKAEKLIAETNESDYKLAKKKAIMAAVERAKRSRNATKET